MMDDLIAFYSARLDEAERTIYREGSPPHGVIAWLTYCEPDGSMIYATVAHGHTAGGPWFAAGKELPEPANILVVYDPVRSLRHIAAGRAVVKRYELAAAAASRGSVSGFVHGQDDGYAEACLDAIRDGAAAWNDHPDYRAEWKAGGVMSEAGGGLTYPDSAGDEMCDSCTCCTVAGCIPSQCGEDDYGRFHCPCTSE